MISKALLDQLPQLPTEWSWVPIRDLVDDERGICYGIVQPGPHVPDGVPMVNTQDVANGSVSERIEFRVSSELHRRFQRSALRGGEILLTLVGANFGRVAVAPPKLAGANCARPVGVLPVREDSPFVMFCLRSPVARKLMDDWANTTAQPTLNLKEVAALPVPWPPPTERRAITAILGALDDKIELNRRLNETLEETARALFKSWFVDFDPVRAKAEGRQPFGMDEATAALFPDGFEDSELGEVPRGWRVRALGDLLAVLETGSRPKGGVAGVESGVPSIGAESIVGAGIFDFAKTKYVSEEFFQSMNRGIIESGDVLVYKDGGKPGQLIPHVSMFSDGFPFARCAINEHVYRVRGEVGVPQTFLYFSLSSDRTMAEMAVKGTGVAVPGLNSTAIRSLRVLTARGNVLEAFDSATAPLLARIFAASNESRDMGRLRDYLLPRLLSGEIRVRDAEKLVGAAL